MANGQTQEHNINIKHLGLITHDEAMPVMAFLHEQRCQDLVSNTVLILEHEPVITKGRRLRNQEIVFDPEIKKRKIQVRDVDRGGLLTFHGRGQVVVYFILKINGLFKGIKEMVYVLEDCLIDFLAMHKIRAERHIDHPGIWVGQKKIASIGLHVKNGVSTHGICLNVNNDLSVYDYFEPCGLSGKVMTSMQQVLARKIELFEFKKIEKSLGMVIQGRLV